ncbi:MAG TPA: homoserine kinase [Longimicrobiales bacterium]|nr:homoserine kinase [Longimicrobiales bacterium]
MNVRRFEVRVPASTSNLGPGFDCLGLAVDRYLELRWDEQGGAGLVRSGERPPDGFGDRLAGGLAALGLPDTGTLAIHSNIPVGRGLGSSAALTVALTVLDAARRGAAVERFDLLRTVAADEGHPDNAAPAVVGGLVSAMMNGAEVSAIPLPLSDSLGWAWAAPGVPASTEAMRAALPEHVDHAAAVRNAARLAQLLPALAVGDGPVLARAMQDELHVPMRLPLIPGGAAVRDAAVDAGAWACTISGAGSGMIAVSPRGAVARVVSVMADAFRAVDPDPDSVVAFELRPDLRGARWGPELSPPTDREVEPPTRRG